MWVRILQGKQAGLVTEVCQSEGENMLTTGFAESVAPPAALVVTNPPVELPAPEPEPEPAPMATASPKAPRRAAKPRAATPKKATRRAPTAKASKPRASKKRHAGR